MDLQAYKEIFDDKGNILVNIDKIILENNQLKETLENIKNSLESIYSDAKVNIKFVLNGIKISKYEIKKKLNENGNIIYFKGDIEFSDDTFASYIIAKFYDGYYFTIKNNDKNIVENLKELKK